MRRLVQHALVGVGVTALAASAAVAGLGSPSAQDTVIAVPAAVVTTSVPSASPTASTDAARAAQQAEETRSASRAQLATALNQATKRSAALGQQSRAITRQQAKIKAAEQAEAASKARAAKARAEAAAERKRAAEGRAESRRLAAAREAEAEQRAEQRAEAAAEARAERAAAAKKVADAQGVEPGTTDPREMAKQILKNKFGYGSDQFSCFNNIIIRESNWDIDATNPSSGAYGIPQALPGSKMASVASDWRTNPATQIIWAVGYMDDRYGSPCQAWTFKSANDWY